MIINDVKEMTYFRMIVSLINRHAFKKKKDALRLKTATVEKEVQDMFIAVIIV